MATFAPAYHLAVVSMKDVPIYELEYSPPSAAARDPQFRSSVMIASQIADPASPSFAGDVKAGSGATTRHLNQFILHASLDIVEEAIWANQSMYNAEMERRKRARN